MLLPSPHGPTPAALRAPLRWALVALLVLTTTPAAARKLTLKQAVDLALTQNHQLQMEQSKVAEADAQRKSTRGLFGPSVTVDGNILVWDSPLAFDLGLPSFDLASMQDPAKLAELVAQYGLTPAELAALGANQDLLSGLFKFFDFDLDNIRDQVTGEIGVTVAQPLTPLLQIYSGYKAQKSMAQSARLDAETKRLDVVFEVTRGYLQLKQAQRFVTIAGSGVEQVEAHLAQAEQYQQAGLIGTQEVLKAKLELARAKQGVIQARTGVSLASAALALHLGLSPRETIEPVEQLKDPPAPMADTLEACIDAALGQNVELRALEAKTAAAQAGKDAATWETFLPQISAVANYKHTEGQGTLMPKDAFFVGGILSWNVWSWGNKYYAMEAARAKVKQAEQGKKLLRNGVVLKVQKAFLELRQAEASLAVSRAAIAEAEENLRIEKKRFESQAATSTDVLDARLALTRAEASHATALYGYYVSAAELRRAMGRQ